MIKRRIFLAWRQLMSRKGRFLVALAGIGFADILIMTQLGFKSALLDSNTRLPSILNADLIIVSSQAQNFGVLKDFSRRRLFQAKNLTEIVRAEPLYLNLATWKNPQTNSESSILVFGFNPAQSAFRLPELTQSSRLIQYPDVVLFDRASNGQYENVIAQIEQGKKVYTEIQGRKKQIIGLYQVGASFIADGSLITSDQNFLRIFNSRNAGAVSLGLVTLKAGSNPNQVAEKLQKELPGDVKVFTRQAYIESERLYWEKNTSIGFVFSFGVIVGIFVGVIIVYQILFSDVSDHLSEYATLKAIGYNDSYLLGVVFQEAIILAIVGFVPGSLISIGLYNLISNATNLPLLITTTRLLEVFLLTLGMCALSGAIAMRKLRSADPADIF
ncbi:ABC transporter permease DevC [Synechococcus sp. PCC 6312]|uniref:ABC transporter permease DevC n=1 Tax=Synechococcus sp. (strain ATCC 27167 / PCC 6312) TaxID=195253 RepID=UPI00029EC7BD|nr:ABC transporter permease DevC [Synechococcus sp. PCC 6312]AFY60283.1 DevC protein [Synechococcus sp. PCC 6312]